MSLLSLGYNPVIEEDSYGWSQIPKDLLVTLFSEVPSNAKCNMACVCKIWHEFLTDQKIGLLLLKERGITPSPSDSWIGSLRNFIDTPRIIALDVSASMDKERLVKSYKVIDKIVNVFFDCIAIRGIDCIVFADLVYSKKVYSKENAMDFFQKEYNEITCDVRLGNGTSTNQLFEYLTELQTGYENINNKLTCEVTIISDFEDSHMSLSYLAPETSFMHIQCINVGNHQGNTYLQFLQQSYNDFLKDIKKYEIELRRLREEEEYGSKPQTRGLKRKREEPVEVSIEIPLNLSLVNEDSWKPQRKKRKIVFTYPK